MEQKLKDRWDNLMNNNIQNAANIGGTAHGPLGQGQILGAQAYNSAAPTLADQFKSRRERMATTAKVLEFIEAQINMDLFKSDPMAKNMYENAMRVALEHLSK